MKYKFDTIFHIKAAQNMVAEHYMKTILTWFSTSRQLYENYFDMIFHLEATIWKLFWHDFPPQGGSKLNCRALGYGRDFDMIF